MSKRAMILGFGLLALIAAALVFFGARTREPVYQGRTLTDWLAQRDNASLIETQRIAEAQAAVRAIGPRRALPFLLDMAQTRDSSLRRWLIQTMEGRSLGLKISEAQRLQRLGLYGFEILGTNGAAAIPELVRLMGNTNQATMVLECLARIGKPAQMTMWQALTNSDPAIRRLSASLLARVTDDTSVLLTRLGQCLQDPAAPVRRAAAEGIGLQTHAPGDAVPLLVATLSDKDEEVASAAARLLANFGTNALRAWPALTHAVETGSDATANRALRALVIIAPDQALPIVLKSARSPLPRRKGNALTMLGEYKTATAEMVAALKTSLADPDPRIGLRARNACLRLRDAMRKAGMAPVVIPDEPVWEGRPLGDWLKQTRGDDFSEPAKTALQKLGTNAIPALVARLVYRDPVFGLSDPEVSTEAAVALAFLGDQANAALPGLARAMDDSDEQVAVLALIAAGEIGSNALPVVAQGLTNRHEEVRSEAVSQLEEGPVRLAPDQLRRVVPFLVRLLDDPNESLRIGATNILQQLAPQAAARAGIEPKQTQPANR